MTHVKIRFSVMSRDRFRFGLGVRFRVRFRSRVRLRVMLRVRLRVGYLFFISPSPTVVKVLSVTFESLLDTLSILEQTSIRLILAKKKLINFEINKTCF